jgi:hypothetical protein
MHDSEVPIQKRRAKQDLINLLKENVDKKCIPIDDDKAFVFDGWEKLCEHYAPVFVEKSPHHLTQWSSIKLILECMEKFKDIEFLIIGLVRNPMDTIYSMWSRWRSRPEQMQYEWLLAYQNLTKLNEILKGELIIVKYEELVAQKSSLEKVYQFLGRDQPPQKILHSKSLSKWRKDKSFGFSLAPEVLEQAEYFGYDCSEFINEGYLAWPIYRELTRLGYKSTSYISNRLRTLKTYIK